MILCKAAGRPSSTEHGCTARPVAGRLAGKHWCRALDEGITAFKGCFSCDEENILTQYLAGKSGGGRCPVFVSVGIGATVFRPKGLN